MDIAQRIQAKTDNGDTIIDFLVEVMTDDVQEDFKLCHRLQAARLLSRYGCCHKGDDTARSPVADEAIDFILDNRLGPSLNGSDSSSSDETLFDAKLAMVIRESTDDGATVCRFLINVMEGELKAFTPQNRLSAARELLDRGFGKHATPRRSGGGRNPMGTGRGEEENQEHQPTPSHTPQPNTQPTESDKSPNPTNQSSDDNEEEIPYDEINAIIDAGIEESNRILAEQGKDPDNPPHIPDYSAFDLAADNSHRWFHEWKNSIDPEEYQAIVKEKAAAFSARIDLRIERRKQIRADRERREKEEAEREAQQAKARAEAKEKAEAEAKEEEDLGPPPTEEEHELVSATPSIPGSFVLRNCRHPKCKLHDKPRYFPEDDRNSPYYFDGRPPPMYGSYPL